MPSDSSTNGAPMTYDVEVTCTIRRPGHPPLTVTLGVEEVTPEMFPSEIAELLGPATIAKLGAELRTQLRVDR